MTRTISSTSRVAVAVASVALLIGACSSAGSTAGPTGSAVPAATAAQSTAPATAQPTSASSSAPSAVGAPPEPTSPVTITYMGGNWQAAWINQVIQPFERLHPNIKVQYEPVAFEDMTTKLESTVGQGQATPDLYMVDQPRVPAYSTAGLVMDLTGKVPDLSGSVYADSIAQSSYNGHLWALPYAESSGFVLYNSAVLNKAGVTLPPSGTQGRWTWEQVVDAAKKAQAAGAKYGILWDQPNLYYQLAMLPESAGGGTGLTGADNLTPNLLTPGWIKAMTWYQQLFTSGVSPKNLTDTQVYSNFSNGQAAFLVAGMYAPLDIPNHKLPMALMAEPYFAGGQPVTPSGSWSIGINPHTPNANAALIFAEYLAIDRAGNAQYATLDGDISSLMSNIDLAFSSSAYAWWPDASKVADLCLDELEHTAVARPRTIGYLQFENIINSVFTDIQDGANPTTRLQQATSDLQGAFAGLK